MIDLHHGWNASFKPQFLGFVLSVLLTIAAYRIVTHHHLTQMTLILALSGVGIAQVIVQLIFFLHLGLETKPRWNLISFLFTVGVILIIIAGSVWIMDNLNYNLMPQM